MQARDGCTCRNGSAGLAARRHRAHSGGHCHAASECPAPIGTLRDILIQLTNTSKAMPAGCVARAAWAPSAGPAPRPAACSIAAQRSPAAHQTGSRQRWEREQQGPAAAAGRRRHAAAGGRAVAAQASSSSSSAAGDEAVDVVVIGSGIGGLSCAGWLAKYGLKVRGANGRAACSEPLQWLGF